MGEWQVQTRSESTGIRVWPTLAWAIAHSVDDPTVWKISYSLPTGERVRMVRGTDDSWKMVNMEDK